MNSLEITKNILEKNSVTKKELDLLKLRANKVGKNPLELLDLESHDIVINGIFLEKSYNDFVLNFLKNKYKTQTGKERKNNPFSPYHQSILNSNDVTILFGGFYNAGSFSKPYFVFETIVKSNTFGYFNYIFIDGKIKITED